MFIKKAISILSLIFIGGNLFLYDYLAYGFSPNEIQNKVFHFDAQDINGDGNLNNNPASGTKIQTITDKFNGFNAFQNDTNKQGTLTANSINNNDAVYLNGTNNIYNLDAKLEIASDISYTEKTFAIVFKTSDDINSLQTIYEQGGKEKGYSIQIENSKLYVGVFNTIDWPVGENFKIANLGDIKANTTYNLIISHNSSSENNFQVISDGKVINNIINIDSQKTHGLCLINGPFSCYLFQNGSTIGFGGTKNDTLRLSNNTNIVSAESNYFKGYIGEFLSWNKTLTSNEKIELFKYLDDKWNLLKPDVEFVKPEKVGSILGTSYQIKVKYNDYQNGSGININSDILEIFKWNGNSWGNDISNSLVNNSNIGKYFSTYDLSNLTNGKYKAVFKISKTNGLQGNAERLFYVGELQPNNLPNTVFHYDAQDINGDGNLNNNPANNSRITTLADKINYFDAYQYTNNKKPRLKNNTINGYPSISFDGNDNFLISNENLINNRSTPLYDQKSFATVFKTGNDVNTFQTIYEQGGTVRGYSFVIHNGHVYAGIWNDREWDIGHQYKSVDLGIAKPNTTYFAMIVQDSKYNDDKLNTLKIYLNGNLASLQTHTDPQYRHPGAISIGSVEGDTVRASDNVKINGSGYNFTGNIGELISWNYALDQADINGIQEYFTNKWGVVMFSEKYPIPSPTSELTPTYTFITNREGTLSYEGSCKSKTTNAIIGDNIINLDSDGNGGNLSNGVYNDCIIKLTDSNGFEHVLNITPFEVEATSYTLTEVTAVPTPGNTHFPQYTFSSPISGTIEYYGGCNSNTTFANIGNNTITFNYLEDGIYSGCYLRVKNDTQTSEFLNITPFEIISSGPEVISSSIENNKLFPIGNFDFDFVYTDDGNLNLNSSSAELYRFDSNTNSWGNDISSSYVSILNKTNSKTDFKITNLNYGKYKIITKIANNAGIYSSIEKIFYVDQVEFILNKGSFNFGDINSSLISSSDEITFTVKTIGAGFQILSKENTKLMSSNGEEIIGWNGISGYGIETNPYIGNIQNIGTITKIFEEDKNINTSGEINTYTYKAKLGVNITTEQAAGIYNGTINFGIKFNY